MKNNGPLETSAYHGNVSEKSSDTQIPLQDGSRPLSNRENTAFPHMHSIWLQLPPSAVIQLPQHLKMWALIAYRSNPSRMHSPFLLPMPRTNSKESLPCFVQCVKELSFLWPRTHLFMLIMTTRPRGRLTALFGLKCKPTVGKKNVMIQLQAVLWREIGVQGRRQRAQITIIHCFSGANLSFCSLGAT